MNILDKIVATKHREVEIRKSANPVKSLEKSDSFNFETRSLRDAIGKSGFANIIAEFKRRSPSRGLINEKSDLSDVCKGYEKAGTSAISVLTDSEYFGGSMDDLLLAKKTTNCPILRKDFIIDEYQIVEARSYGADSVLLIAEILSAASLENLHRFAYSLGLEALVEIHSGESISKIPYDAEIIGINSRNLSSFKVDIEHPSQIVSLLPGKAVKVAESGIKSVSDAQRLTEAGFDAFLIGEYFMSSPDPAETCRKFISDLGKFRPINRE